MSRPCWLRSLPAPELIEWLTLRRVRWGGVAIYGARYLDLGRPVPCYLDEPFNDLCRRGLVELVDCADCCVWRVTLTQAGTVRWAALSERRGIPPAERAPFSLSDLPTGDPPRRSGRCPLPPPRRRRGRELPAERTPTFSVPPSLGASSVCGWSGRLPRPAAVFPTPDEQHMTPAGRRFQSARSQLLATGRFHLPSRYAQKFRLESERECLTRWAARLRMFAHNAMLHPDDMTRALEMAAEIERLRERLGN